MNDLSNLSLREFFLIAKEGDYHIYNVPDSDGVVRKEVKSGGQYELIVSQNGKELGRQKHNNPVNESWF